jgi:hypothetical protein
LSLLRFVSIGGEGGRRYSGIEYTSGAASADAGRELLGGESSSLLVRSTGLGGDVAGTELVETGGEG